ADPTDTRSQMDLIAALENEAECYEDMEEGLFGIDTNSAGSAKRALELLSEDRQILERTVKMQPSDIHSRALLGGALIRIAAKQRMLDQQEQSLTSAKMGVTILKDVAQKADATADLDQVVTGLSTVEPANLREPELAVIYGQRLVEMSHHQKPHFLVSLATAYESAGRAEDARRTAQEGLNLLSPSGSSHTRKLLESELAPKHVALTSKN